MKLLPIDSYEIETTQTLEEAAALLSSNVEPRKWFRFGRSHKLFEGEVTYEGFKILRIINYRNSFLPIIRGTFEQTQTGVKLALRMSLHPFVIAFMCVWFGGVGLGMLACVGGLIRSLSVPLPVFFIPFAMLIFGWLLISGCFWFEVNKAKIMLNDIFHKSTTTEQLYAANRP